jgi:hypothetical protein
LDNFNHPTQDAANSQDDLSEKSTGRRTNFWPWLIGAAGGAVIVGAAWGITAYAGGNVIAKVGDTAIHRSEFYSRMESTSGAPTLQEMITEQLVQNAAKKYNISASQQDINDALANFEANYGISGSDQLSAFLAQNGITMSQLQDILKIQVLEKKLSVRNVQVTDKEIQDYYSAHKADFTKPGSTKPEPLTSVRNQVIEAVKQSKAVPPAQLIANLAKEQSITILDNKYATVKDQIVNPQPSLTTGQ